MIFSTTAAIPCCYCRFLHTLFAIGILIMWWLTVNTARAVCVLGYFDYSSHFAIAIVYTIIEYF